MGKKESPRKEDAPRESKPFIGIKWECCKVYSHIYLNKKKTAYVGWCPRCGKRAQINLSPTGSKSRFFNVS